MDKQILNIIQKDFPIVNRPFKLLGDELGYSESVILSKIKELKYDKSIIRDISAIFNTKLLGFTSCLIAIKAKTDNLLSLIAHINENPLVSHNYLRNCEYNMWFTISMTTIDQINTWIDSLKREYNLDNILILPSKRVFKRNVFFNFLPNKDDLTTEKLSKPIDKTLDTDNRLILQLLEKDLPLSEAPFFALTKDYGIKEDEFIEQANKLKSSYLIRRYSAVLRHNNAGFAHNALIVWNINEDEVENTGKIFSSYEFVSHCYERPRLDSWNYNLYTMLHATSEEKLLEYNAILSKIAYPSPFLALKTVKELKKERVKYFCIN